MRKQLGKEYPEQNWREDATLLRTTAGWEAFGDDQVGQRPYWTLPKSVGRQAFPWLIGCRHLWRQYHLWHSFLFIPSYVPRDRFRVSNESWMLWQSFNQYSLAQLPAVRCVVFLADLTPDTLGSFLQLIRVVRLACMTESIFSKLTSIQSALRFSHLPNMDRAVCISSRRDRSMIVQSQTAMCYIKSLPLSKHSTLALTIII